MESPRSSLYSTIIMTLPLVVVPAIALLRPPSPGSGPSSTDLTAGEDEDFFAELEQFNASSRLNDPAAPAGDSGFSEVSSDDEFDSIFGEDPEPAGNGSRGQQSAGSGASGRPFPGSGLSGRGTANGDPPVNGSATGSSVAAPPDSPATDPFLDGPLPPQTPVPRSPVRPGGDTDGPVATPRPHPAPPDAQQDEVRLLRQLHALGVVRTLWFAPGPGRHGFAAFIRARDPNVEYRFEAVGASRSAVLQDVLAQLRLWKQDQAGAGGVR